MENNQHIALKKAPAQMNQSLKTGLEFLLRLATSDEPIVLTEVARELNMDYTRVNRLFGTLAAMGFAERTTDRRYIAGPGIHIIATLGLHKSHLLGVAAPHLYKLAHRMNMLVALGVLWGRHVCYIYHGGPDSSFGDAIDNSQLYEAEHSSIGLAMLARMPDSEIHDLYSNDPEADMDKIMEQINFARVHNFARGGKLSPSLAIGVGEPCIAGLAISPGDKPYDESVLVHELNLTANTIYTELNCKKNIQPA